MCVACVSPSLIERREAGWDAPTLEEAAHGAQAHGGALRVAELRVAEPAELAVPACEHVDVRERAPVGALDFEERQVAPRVNI